MQLLCPLAAARWRAVSPQLSGSSMSARRASRISTLPGAPCSAATLIGVCSSWSKAFKWALFITWSILIIAATCWCRARMWMTVRDRMLRQERSSSVPALRSATTSPRTASATLFTRVTAWCEASRISWLVAPIPPGSLAMYSRMAVLSDSTVAWQLRTSRLSSFLFTWSQRFSSLSLDKAMSYGFPNSCASFASRTHQHRSKTSAESSVTTSTRSLSTMASAKGHAFRSWSSAAMLPCCQMAKLQTQMVVSRSRAPYTVCAKSGKGSFQQ
mmetsp:Transcript_30424/g.87219  ORF Transcript_30424/g.87219 Transcript_30424/m.87219 type:complete len:271 (-) Transcript_30424:545-1357(-)